MRAAHPAEAVWFPLGGKISAELFLSLRHGLESSCAPAKMESMPKGIEQIESRLERLEKELAEVKAALTGKPKARWCR
jgi:hypothetical protein